MTRATGLLAGLALALLAQWCFDGQAIAAGVALAAAAALLSGVAGGGLLAPGEAVAVAAPARLTPRRRLGLAAGAATAGLGVLLMAPNRFTALGTLAWLVGLGAVLASLRQPLAAAGDRGAGRAAWAWPVLAAILAAAALLRFHLLADLPAEAGCDIPLKLRIVRGMLDGERPIFSAVYPGREVGFFYVTAVYGAVAGADQLALKAVSAAFSVATVAALYALGRRWFGVATGLLAAGWLALSPWHIAISRIGYRGVLTPLMVALALLALDRALARGARRDWALLGLVAGACGYTYTASLAIPLALAGVWLAGGWRAGRGAGWAAALLVAILTAAPLARVAVGDSALVTQRAFSRAGTEPISDLGARLLGNAGRSLGMFNVRGDVIATQNVAFRRQLGFVSAALFLCGLGIAVAARRQRRPALALWFLLVMQVPSALALGFPDEVPGSVRASGALIPACLLAALPLPLLWRAAPRRRWAAAAVALIALALLATEGRETGHRYFVEYPKGLPFGNYPLSRTIAAAMDGYAGRGPVYLPAYPYWLDGGALRVQLQRLPLGDLHELSPDDFTTAIGAAAPPLMAVLQPGDERTLALLRARFPGGAVARHANEAGEAMFVTFTTP